MALKATVFKCHLQVADIERHYYHDHHLTIARHPSENDARMMVRILAFTLNASESLTFTKGLSTDHEPDLWQKDLTDRIEKWIEVGLPSLDRLKKIAHKADQVFIYAYGARTAPEWWKDVGTHLSRYPNLKIFLIGDGKEEELTQLVDRSMKLQVNIQDEDIWIGNGETEILVSIQTLL